MAVVSQQRRIVDRRTIAAKVVALAESKPPSEVLRQGFIEILKQSLASGRDFVRRSFERGASGSEVVHALSFLVDQLVRTIHEFAETVVFPGAESGEDDRLAVVAVGGYGRGELAPYSDVDLLFVVPAWIFVALRLGHAYVHVTSNRVTRRALFFLAGAAVLCVMWIIFAIRILSGT